MTPRHPTPFRHSPPGRRTDRLATGAIATAVAASLAAAALLIDSDAGHPDPPQPGAADGLALYTGASLSTAGGRITLPPSTPLTLRVPAVGIAAPLTGYGLGTDGTLQVPAEEDSHLAAWFHGGVTPGAPGTALIAGHVDDGEGPAVFYHLGALHRDDTIEVDRADGRTAVFTIDGIEVFDRDAFPDELVYGHSEAAELRLITCGGPFSDTDGYLANVVVFAHLTAVV